MVPLPGRKYDKAELRHMAHKILPSIEGGYAREFTQCVDAFIAGWERH